MWLTAAPTCSHLGHPTWHPCTSPQSSFSLRFRVVTPHTATPSLPQPLPLPTVTGKSPSSAWQLLGSYLRWLGEEILSLLAEKRMTARVTALTKVGPRVKAKHGHVDDSLSLSHSKVLTSSAKAEHDFVPLGNSFRSHNSHDKSPCTYTQVYTHIHTSLYSMFVVVFYGRAWIRVTH